MWRLLKLKVFSVHKTQSRKLGSTGSWGLMNFWGAPGLALAINVAGDTIVAWLWEGPTLNRLFLFTPLYILVGSSLLLHLPALLQYPSNNPFLINQIYFPHPMKNKNRRQNKTIFPRRGGGIGFYFHDSPPSVAVILNTLDHQIIGFSYSKCTLFQSAVSLLSSFLIVTLHHYQSNIVRSNW